ncbi:MAG: FtsW/RodA/SpoVE family cell cycle protein [Anaerolineae bacterium]|nr:FtsW/RodA/SpoVE family cell cycle protein [Anaerolineae bacterium]
MNQNPASVDPNQKLRNMRQTGSTGHAFFTELDLVLLLIVAILLVIGLLMVYSSSWNFGVINGFDPAYILNRQVMWVGLGIVASLVLSRIDYHKYQRLAVPMILVTLLLLLVVLIVGNLRFNATRTLVNGSVQPSELAKMAAIIYLSFWLYSKQEHINDVSLGLLPMAIILGLISGFIFLQPDLSAGLTIILLGGILFYVADGDFKQILLVVIMVAIMAWILIAVSSTGRTRLADYLSGLQNPEQASYHVRRSIEAVVRGGWFGVGIGNSATKFTGLPVPWTDSIFAVIAEETGLFGATFVIILYAAFLWRGLLIANHAPDMLGKLLASGVTIWITIEAIINMGVLVNLFPFAGNALPLVSAGGSNLVTTMVGIGILLNVSRQGNKIAQDAGRVNSAVVDMRWRNGGGRVSRPRRSESNH